MTIETILPPASTENSSNAVDTQQTITLPRRIVYIQAGLLGVIATTFFVFGMMVGSLTSNNGFRPEIVDCEVSGTVKIEKTKSADSNAVVLILPMDKTPERRMNPRSIHPGSFIASDNEVIESILAMGGAVIRTNRDGQFKVVVDSPGRYNVFVISGGNSSSRALTKKEMAALSTYFMPAEDVRSGKAVSLRSVRLDSTTEKLGEIFCE